jgi:DNA-binding MarR family transcriptional regulator
MPESDVRRTANRILQVVPKVMRFLASDLRREPYGLAPTQFRSMMMLVKHPRSLTELAEAQSVSMPTMSNTISVLVERGWVERRRDAADRRKLVLEITEKGEGVLRNVRQLAERRLQSLLEPLNREQCESLVQGLGLLDDVFSIEVKEAENSGDVD